MAEDNVNNNSTSRFSFNYDNSRFQGDTAATLDWQTGASETYTKQTLVGDAFNTGEALLDLAAPVGGGFRLLYGTGKAVWTGIKNILTPSEIGVGLSKAVDGKFLQGVSKYNQLAKRGFTGIDKKTWSEEFARFKDKEIVRALFFGTMKGATNLAAKGVPLAGAVGTATGVAIEAGTEIDKMGLGQSDLSPEALNQIKAEVQLLTQGFNELSDEDKFDVIYNEKDGLYFDAVELGNVDLVSNFNNAIMPDFQWGLNATVTGSSFDTYSKGVIAYSEAADNYYKQTGEVWVPREGEIYLTAEDRKEFTEKFGTELDGTQRFRLSSVTGGRGMTDETRSGEDLFRKADEALQKNDFVGAAGMGLAGLVTGFVGGFLEQTENLSIGLAGAFGQNADEWLQERGTINSGIYHNNGQLVEYSFNNKIGLVDPALVAPLVMDAINKGEINKDSLRTEEGRKAAYLQVLSIAGNVPGGKLYDLADANQAEEYTFLKSVSKTLSDRGLKFTDINNLGLSADGQNIQVTKSFAGYAVGSTFMSSTDENFENVRHATTSKDVVSQIVSGSTLDSQDASINKIERANYYNLLEQGRSWLSANGLYGLATSEIDDLLNKYKGYPVNDQTILEFKIDLADKYGERIISERGGADWVKESIYQGKTITDALSPHLSVLAELYKVPITEIDLTGEYVQMAFKTDEKTGMQIPKPIGEFLSELKDTPLYQSSQPYQNKIANSAAYIDSYYGI